MLWARGDCPVVKLHIAYAEDLKFGFTESKAIPMSIVACM